MNIERLIEQRAQLRSGEQRKATLLERVASEERTADARSRDARRIAEEIGQLEARVAQLRKAQAAAESDSRSASVRADRARQEARSLTVPETWQLDDQIERGRQANEDRAAKLDRQRRFRDAANQAANAKERWQEMTDQLAELEGRKVAALKQAAAAVPGIGIDGGVITVDGQPLSQASTSQQMRTALTVAAKLRPALRLVWLDRGESLDEDATATVEAWARQHGYTVILTRVGTGDRQAITIQAGEIAA